MRPFVPVLLVVLLIAAGCPAGPSDPDDTSPPPECALDLSLELRAPGGTYVPVGPGIVDAELVLGFQGFRYVYLRTRTTDPTDHASAAAAHVQVDGQAATSQPLGDLVFTPDPAGGFVSKPMHVFFNDEPLPALIDHECDIVLYTDTSCQAGGRSRLRFDDSCYEDAYGVRFCPDGGLPPDGGS